MVNVEKMNSVEEFKKALLEIQRLLDSDIELTRQDRVVLYNLTTVLENQVKIKLFDKIVQSKNNEHIISDIDSKIEEISQKMDELSQQKEELPLSKQEKDQSIYKRKVENYQLAIQKLKELKENYIHKDYEQLVKSSFDLDKEKELIRWCCSSLAVGYFEFETLFGESLAENKKWSDDMQPNYDFINNFFEVYQNQDIIQKLKEYFSYADKEKRMKEDKDIALELNKILPSLEKSEEDIRDYLYYELIRRTYETDISSYKKQLETECRKMKSSSFSIFKKKKIEQLEKAISVMDHYFGYDLTSLENKLKDLEIYDYIDKILTTMMGKNSFIGNPRDAKEEIGSLYWFASQNKKAHVGNMYVDVTDFKKVPFEKKMEKNSSKLQHIEEEIQSVEKLKEEAYQKLPIETKEQLAKDPRGVKMVASMDERPERYGRSPIVCAYILRVIGQMKNIPIQDMVNELKMDQQELEKLEKKYSEILERELNRQHETVESIYSHTINR